MHSDSAAANTAKSISARAFTLSNHVVMGSGEYQPNSQSGQRLLGHELTHVVQQNDDKDERISRVPTRGGIQERPPRYIYSTNCGWIDWSHASTRIPASRWPAELSNINDSSTSSLYEIRSISATQGSESFSFSPRYRVVGLINETDLLIISIGGTRFIAADNVQVVPTYRAYSGTHGLYGHVQMTQVRPYRQSDRNVFTHYNISWPIYVPDPVLQPLTSPGSGSSGTRP